MIRFVTAGESHGKALVSVIEGVPAGLPLLAEDVDAQLARRQQGYGRGRRMQIETDDGVKLYYEEAGTGDPIVFVHEFGGHHLSWETQMRYFSRRYRCFTYQARGWPPSPSRCDGWQPAPAAG